MRVGATARLFYLGRAMRAVRAMNFRTFLFGVRAGRRAVTPLLSLLFF
jgi:hypothetical protein